MPNDNKLAHLVAPRIAVWRKFLTRVQKMSLARGEVENMTTELGLLVEIERQVQADLIAQAVPTPDAPKDEVSVLLDLFQVAAMMHDELACQMIRRDIAKVMRHGCA